MKLIKVLLTVFPMLIFSACDIIDEPVKNNTGGGGGNNGDKTVQNILVEKFTGHRCNNCPSAEVTAKQLKDQYGDQLVFISYHVMDNFAGPTPDKPKDWRTPEGTAIFNFYRFFGIPVGMINRMDYTSSGLAHHKSHGTWGGLIQGIINNEPVFELSVTTEWSNRNSEVHIDVTALQNYSDAVKLVVAATESNIIAPQTLPDYSTDEEYVHENMFRFSYNNTFGTTLKSGWGTGDVESVSFQKQVSQDHNENNVYVVAYIYNEATHKVLQCVRVPLLP
jgi:hypothetical protein